MAGSITNSIASSIDQVKVTDAQARGAIRPAQDDGTIGWFLPGSEVNLQTIDANQNADLQGASPESVANQIISHLGA